MDGGHDGLLGILHPEKRLVEPVSGQRLLTQLPVGHCEKKPLIRIVPALFGDPPQLADFCRARIIGGP